jgi:SAM-dependent methyltransferase
MAKFFHFTRDPRPPEQIRQQYDVERELAGRLRRASPEERKGLYTQVYDEFHDRVPHQRMQHTPEAERKESVDSQVRWLRANLGRDSTFLEVGAGDCRVTLALAPLVRKAIALEVSKSMIEIPGAPANFELVISDGTSVPVPPGTVDVVHSQQVIEHLHPDDALEQLRNIHAALKPGGKYFCGTPNRLTGPYDISRHYDESATGLHLKEYTFGELARLFRGVGFRKVYAYVNTESSPRALPVWPIELLEVMLAPLPRSWRIRIARPIRPRVLFTIRMLGVK